MQFAQSFDGAPPLTTRSGQLGYAVHPFLTAQPDARRSGTRISAASPATHPVMATAFNAQAGGGYCRPELPSADRGALAYLHEKRIGLVAWALDMPNLREPDGSYSTLDDLVCGQRKDGGQGGAGEMIHEYFLAN